MKDGRRKQRARRGEEESVGGEGEGRRKGIRRLCGIKGGKTGCPEGTERKGKRGDEGKK